MYGIVSINLYSTSHSVHQSETPPLWETQRELREQSWENK